MPHSTVSVGILCAIFLSGCATPYQKEGTDVSGGHSFRQLAEDIFEIEFKANGFTSPKRAQDFAMLRAAEITLEHSFRYFSIIGEADRSHSDSIRVDGPSYTTGRINSYGGLSTYSGTTTHTTTEIPIFKPGKLLSIKCYVSPPGGHSGRVEDARAVVQTLRQNTTLNEAPRVAVDRYCAAGNWAGVVD